MEVHDKSFKDLELEVMFVNDGSTDKSWEELLRLKDTYEEQITLLNLSRNFGQLAALFAAFNHIRGDAVICISADLQDPISLMAKMVAYWRNDTEIVVCYRENRTDEPFSQVLSKIVYSIARVSYSELPRGGFDYWLMSRKVCELLCSLKGRHNFLQGNLLSVGFSKAFIPYTRMRRAVGKSGYSFGKKLHLAIDYVVDSSYLPIRFMSCVGAFISLSGAIYSVLIGYAWLVHQTPFPGWAPLMIVLMFIGGILMIMLGVIGEYVWRIYDDLKGFPPFIVETKLSLGRDEDSK